MQEGHRHTISEGCRGKYSDINQQRGHETDNTLKKLESLADMTTGSPSLVPCLGFAQRLKPELQDDGSAV